MTLATALALLGIAGSHQAPAQGRSGRPEDSLMPGAALHPLAPAQAPLPGRRAEAPAGPSKWSAAQPSACSGPRTDPNSTCPAVSVVAFAEPQQPAAPSPRFLVAAALGRTPAGGNGRGSASRVRAAAARHPALSVRTSVASVRFPRSSAAAGASRPAGRATRLPALAVRAAVAWAQRQGRQVLPAPRSTPRACLPRTARIRQAATPIPTSPRSPAIGALRHSSVARFLLPGWAVLRAASVRAQGFRPESAAAARGAFSGAAR